MWNDLWYIRQAYFSFLCSAMIVYQQCSSAVWRQCSSASGWEVQNTSYFATLDFSSGALFNAAPCFFLSHKRALFLLWGSARRNECFSVQCTRERVLFQYYNELDLLSWRWPVSRIGSTSVLLFYLAAVSSTASRMFFVKDAKCTVSGTRNIFQFRYYMACQAFLTFNLAGSIFQMIHVLHCKEYIEY